LTALEAWRCGFVCLEEAAATAAIAMAVGISTIGPLAAFGRRTRAGKKLLRRDGVDNRHSV
jgi:hypothetical protein